MKNIVSTVLLILVAATFALANDVSFRRVKVADPKGKQVNAVLTFSDADTSVEVRPAKGDALTVPYAQVDKFSYEFTRKHRIKAGLIVFFLVDMPAGVVVMCTKSTRHWLVLNYHDQDIPHTFIVRMDKHEYLHILEAIKAHTGNDAEVLGNANKRGRPPLF